MFTYSSRLSTLKTFSISVGWIGYYPKVLHAKVLSAIVKPCWIYFTHKFFNWRHLQANWWFSWHMFPFTNNLPENFNGVRSRLLYCKVFRFARTRCFCFLHLNFMITPSFFFMRWQQACRQSGCNDIPVSDTSWHTDCSRTSSAISDGTGLISRVSLLLYLAVFSLLRFN